MNIKNFHDDFKKKIDSSGIRPPNNVVADGEIHRFPTNDNIGDKAGWYVLKDLGFVVIGSFGCFRSGVKGNWKSVDKTNLSKNRSKISRNIKRKLMNLQNQRDMKNRN